MARGLTERIFDYLFEHGYLERGSVVVDCFGGVGSTAIIGASRGCRVFTCELEKRFWKLSKKNIALHRRTWERFGDPIPVAVCGDSRRLCEVLGPVMADVVISSPPYAGIIRGDGAARETAAESREKRNTEGGSLGQSCRAQGYGDSDGNISALPEGDVDAIVSSPPYEGSFSGGEPATAEATRQKMRDKGYDESSVRKVTDGAHTGGLGYGTTTGNIGNTSGDTFWSAARDIVAQCHQILKPGGVAAWVLKSFVRKGAIVDFPGQWLRLCEACGFELVEEVHASLVKEHSHPSLFDDEPIVKRTERKSFFRRLHEAKRPDLSIDYEVVLFVRTTKTLF